MTREEAIKKLQKQKAEYLEEWVDYSGVAEAYDMAIEALSEPSIVRCAECKHSEKCCQNIIDDPDGVPTKITSCSYGERREP